MDYLMKNYLEKCKAEVSFYGFRRKGKAFVRVVNDVMQIFESEKIQTGLCLGELRKFELPDISLVSLWSSGPRLDAWEYDSKLEENMDACVEDIIRYLDKHLLPFFERANSCETALPEWIKLEQLFYDNAKIYQKNVVSKI
jgi:hypothetical protein